MALTSSELQVDVNILAQNNILFELYPSHTEVKVLLTLKNIFLKPYREDKLRDTIDIP
jgi:hypothetical protein